MRERGSNAKPQRRTMKTTDSQQRNPLAPNLLNRDFTADAPNTTWAADSTGIETREGWLSLAAIVDLFSRLVVGWAMGKERDENVVTKAGMMAREQRCPPAGLTPPFGSGKPIDEPRLSRFASRAWHSSQYE